MNSLSSKLLRAATLALAIPALGLCANVNVAIGALSVCVNGTNCSNPTPVTFGNTQSGSTANSFTVGSDMYSLTSNFTASYNGSGTSVIFNPVATYTGSMNSSASTSMTVDFYASFYDNTVINWDSTYTEHVPFSIGINTLAASNLYIDGQGVGLIGVYGPGHYDVTKTAMLTGLTSSTLTYDYRFIFNFLAGTTPGTCDSADPSVTSCFGGSAVPEPAQMIPAALSLAGFGLVALRRRKQ